MHMGFGDTNAQWLSDVALFRFRVDLTVFVAICCLYITCDIF